jgi:hypothetical protein
MYFGKFGKLPFAKGALFKAPIGVLAGSYPRFISPGFVSFPPGGFI